jgi:hypothetical protein
MIISFNMNSKNSINIGINDNIWELAPFQYMFKLSTGFEPNIYLQSQSFCMNDVNN